MICTVDPSSFGMNYSSISFDQLSGYIVFCAVPILEAKPPYKLNTKHNVARKLAQRKGTIIYAKAGWANLSCCLPKLFLMSRL